MTRAASQENALDLIGEIMGMVETCRLAVSGLGIPQAIETQTEGIATTLRQAYLKAEETYVLVDDAKPAGLADA